MVTINSYKKLNGSYMRKLVFRLGCDGGFFSEYNNMIICMIYCLCKRIEFTLYSKGSSFGYKDNWTDYFLPFCPEDENSLHRVFNMRFPHKYLLFKWMMQLFKYSQKNIYLTSDIFETARKAQIQEIIEIPHLELKGNLQKIARKLVQMTWHYNTETSQSVKSLINSLHLPEKYIGLHIRGGDKFTEAQFQSADKYIQKAKELSKIRNAFVLTDDYTIIESLRQNYTDWNFYTLCGKNERGYFHKEFKKQSKQYKTDQQIKLFASMDVLSGSEYFIGTFSSNPGMYLGMRMAPGKTYSVDIPDWRIW